MKDALFALAAMIPAAIGPLPVEQKPISSDLCGGGSIELDFPQRQHSQKEPCHAKGCHAPGCRKRFDPAQ
jgi:hypothetical protein